MNFTEAAEKRTDVLVEDLVRRAKNEPAVGLALKTLYQTEKKQGRTGEPESQWRRMRLTQIAAGWVLSCTFVRTLEDRGLLQRARIASEDGSATDSQQQFETMFPFLGPADYLLAVFRELQRFPGLQDVFDSGHNPVWHLAPSPGAVQELLAFLRERTDDGALRWTFATDDPSKVAETRFLGDLYQDLNTDVQKRYALLQTPDFVEELILEETLDPAIERFGLEETKVLDPTCGSGHFLLGAFDRLLEAWHKQAPGLDQKERVQKALSQVYGADINPYAVSIARFRLVLAATVAAGIERLDADDVPHWPVQLCICNSLLVRDRSHEQQLLAGEGFQTKRDEAVLTYELANAAEVDAVFGQRYEAVVGNPPYITEKDATVRNAVRDRYDSAAGKYALAAPFTERFYQLACDDGYVGMINSNAWNKREYGKPLIEQVLPRYRLNLVVDTAGAYIPGHGTPTLLVFGQNAPQTSDTVREIGGKRGEPSTPADPANGFVWSSIRDQRHHVGYEDDFVRVALQPREHFHEHPWRLGPAGDLSRQIDDVDCKLAQVAVSIGPGAILGEDDAFGFPPNAIGLRNVQSDLRRPVVEGDQVRDWSLSWATEALFPYTADIELVTDSILRDALWPLRRTLESRKDFSKKTYRECGRPYWEYHQIPVDRNRTPLSIAYAEVATHNHFVLDRGGKVFKQTAPVIKLKPEATEDDHLALLGLLNSSVACFWMKQVTQIKTQTSGMDADAWRLRRQFDGTKLQSLPLVDTGPLELAREIDALAGHLGELVAQAGCATTNADAEYGQNNYAETLCRMVTLQEELDWWAYAAYGLSNAPLTADVSDLPPIHRGERAFEIALARRESPDDPDKRWFTYEDITPTRECPAHWPPAYRDLVERRIALIEADRNVGLIEQPNYKRRWNIEPWDKQVDRALRAQLLERLESPDLWPDPDSAHLRPLTLAALADKAAHDPAFQSAATRLRGSDNYDVEKLVEEMALPEGLPVQSACRYKQTGLEKRADWEHTWELQRMEDRGEDPGEIPVPPKYKSSDFQRSDYWRNRGKLDVPKETFLLYPHCGKQGEVLLGWAGWDHLQQIRALTNLYQQRSDEDGWDRDQLLPILVAMHEVLPWVEQWHNEPDPVHGTKNGDAFRAYLDEQLRRHSLTADDLRSWRP